MAELKKPIGKKLIAHINSMARKAVIQAKTVENGEEFLKNSFAKKKMAKNNAAILKMKKLDLSARKKISNSAYMRQKTKR